MFIRTYWWHLVEIVVGGGGGGEKGRHFKNPKLMGFNPKPVRCQIQRPLKLSVSDPGALKAFSVRSRAPQSFQCQIQGPLKLSVSDPGAFKAFNVRSRGPQSFQFARCPLEGYSRVLGTVFLTGLALDCFVCWCLHQYQSSRVLIVKKITKKMRRHMM